MENDDKNFPYKKIPIDKSQEKKDYDIFINTLVQVIQKYGKEILKELNRVA